MKMRTFSILMRSDREDQQYCFATMFRFVVNKAYRLSSFFLVVQNIFIPNMRTIILPVVLLLLLPWCQTVKGQEILCHLKGVIVDSDSKNLLLFPETEDPLRSDCITIPIVDKTFAYDLKVKEILKYQLIFQDELEQGVMRPVVFFPANGSIRFTLHDMQSFSKNRIEGGDLNRRMPISVTR